MQLEAVRLPQVAYPVQGTEAGTPVMQRETIPFGAIMPAPILPEEHSKTRDRDPDARKPETGDETEAEPAASSLPEAFKLLKGKDFQTILRFLSLPEHQRIFTRIQKLKEERGVLKFNFYPEFFVETLAKSDAIMMQYEQTVGFYHQRPGTRFAGKM